MKKGQLTIEYLIILVVMLILFMTISMDLIESSATDTFSLQTGEMIYTTHILLNNSVESIKLQGSGAKKTVQLRAPSDCDYIVAQKQIVVFCQEGSASYDGYHNTNVGPQIPASIDIIFECSSCTPTETGEIVIGAGVLETLEIKRL